MSEIDSRKADIQRASTHLIAVGILMLSLVVSRTAYADWSDVEKKTWAQLEKEGAAVLAQGDVISAKFLDHVLTGKLFSPTVLKKGVTIIGGTVAGPLDLQHSKFDMPMLHFSTGFIGQVDISDSEFTGSLSFRGSKMPDGLRASRTLIAGSFQLGDLDDTTWFGEWIVDRGPTYSVISDLIAPHLRLSVCPKKS